MANLVGGGKSQVVGGSAASGNRAEEDRATVVKEVFGVVDIREVAVSEKTTTETHEVHVESLVVTLAESPLHAGLITISEPASVGGAVRAKKVERDARGGVALVQDFQLLLQRVRK